MSIKIAFSFYRKLFAQAMPSPNCLSLTASNTAVLQARCVYQDSQFVLLDSESNKLKTVFDSMNFPLSRGWENSRQLCKPSTSSRVCINVSNSPNPSRVYIRLCKQGKRFLLLN